MRGDELVDLLDGGALDAVAADAAANELLNCIFQGYDLGNIRRLVHSAHEQTVGSAAWIISELGADASRILDEVDFLLGHRERIARFFAVSATLAAASSSDGALLAKAIALISDADEAVRWQVLRMLTRIPSGLLQTAEPYISNNRLRELVNWLVEYGDDLTQLSDIRHRLEVPDRLTVLFAAAASARLAGRDRSAIEFALASSDDEVRRFARRELRTTPKGL